LTRALRFFEIGLKLLGNAFTGLPIKLFFENPSCACENMFEFEDSTCGKDSKDFYLLTIPRRKELACLCRSRI